MYAIIETGGKQLKVEKSVWKKLLLWGVLGLLVLAAAAVAGSYLPRQNCST